MPPPDPRHIMQIGTGFMASKTLLSAVELGLFTRLEAASTVREATRGRLLEALLHEALDPAEQKLEAAE